jgi:hypothetical protein
MTPWRLRVGDTVSIRVLDVHRAAVGDTPDLVQECSSFCREG